MLLRGSLLRAAARGVGLALISGALLAPVHSQVMPRGEEPGIAEAPKARRESPAWVKLCERGLAQDLAKAAETCTTLTEQLDPKNGQLIVAVMLRQVKEDGAERNTLSLTVAAGAAIETGAAIVVLPPDLWSKVQRGGKLDAADDVRLKARTVKLRFKSCSETGCVAETEAAPLTIDLLKGNAGLLVLSVRPGNAPVARPVPLTGFAQALEGPPTDSRRFKEARDQLLRQLGALRKTPTPPSIPPSSTGIAGVASWMKVCDRGTIKGKMKDGSPIEKSVEMCMTTAEMLHPQTARPVIVATLTEMMLDGKEKKMFGVTVSNALKLEAGANVAVLPADLWRKAKGKEKLDSSEESRLEASTLQLTVKFCLPAGCHAETDATPQVIDMLRGNAGLRVRTERPSGQQDSQLLSLDGFNQALSGPATRMAAYKEARERLVKDILAREKRKEREEARRKKENEGE